MLAGLDVGGTHTDAVLLDAAGGGMLAHAKARTRPDDILASLLKALEGLFAQGPNLGKRCPALDPGRVKRLTVSTTVGLNALLTGKARPAGILAVPGPGLDARLFRPGDPLFRVLDGAQDHRGRVVAAPDEAALEAAFALFERHRIEALGIVCKFSPKNPELELALADKARSRFGRGMPLVLGHQVSGSLNFPRRINTVWCNAALAPVSRDFSAALAGAVQRLGLACPIAVLKADAGSFSLEDSALDPAGSMGSGPAASLLGVWALSGGEQSRRDTLMVDMGGTSTDLALLAGGQPLLSDRGLMAGGRPTLARTLWTHSFALGGDSSLRLDKGRPVIGPDRQGPALALESEQTVNSRGNVPTRAAKRPPTLTDALNVLGLGCLGDPRISLAALGELAQSPDCPARADGKALAALFVQSAAERIRAEAEALLGEVNSRPVYTIRELLVEQSIAPECALLIGGPAKAMAAPLAEALGLDVQVPEGFAVANALGAALALPARAAELYADTLLGRMTVPGLGSGPDPGPKQSAEPGRTPAPGAAHAEPAPAAALEKRIGPDYDLEEAKADLLAGLNRLADNDRKAQIVFAERFVVLDGGGRRGRILRLKAQLASGLALTPKAQA